MELVEIGFDVQEDGVKVFQRDTGRTLAWLYVSNELMWECQFFTDVPIPFRLLKAIHDYLTTAIKRASPISMTMVVVGPLG